MWITAASLLVLALLIWELWICEGAHLGKHFVVWLYDLAAKRYDRIKKFDADWERRFLGEPLATALGRCAQPRLLDVGAGTGRSARALLPLTPANAQWHLVSLEPSRPMLELGRSHTSESVKWVQGWGVPLPFPPESFDIVVALEMLEFTPSPSETLRECLRVLRPGGLLLVTNRVSWEAPLILGRTCSRREFPDLLIEAGFEAIQVYPWQVDYDLAWAQRP